ncbi:unnamed protein product [Ectocarpus sp. 12 AP-2014]
MPCGSRPHPATDVEQKLEEVKGAEDGLRGKHDTARVVGGGLEFGFGRQHRGVSVRGTRDKSWMLAVVGGAAPFFCIHLSRPTCNSCISVLLVVFFSMSSVLLASSGVIVVTVFIEYHKAQSISLRLFGFSAGVSIALALACPPPPVPRLCFSFARFR